MQFEVYVLLQRTCLSLQYMVSKPFLSKHLRHSDMAGPAAGSYNPTGNYPTHAMVHVYIIQTQVTQQSNNR